MKNYKLKAEALINWLKDRKEPTGLNKREKKEEELQIVKPKKDLVYG